MNVALCSEHLNIISLCTGGAGLDLGVELAIPGARIVCMVEREGFAVAHLVSAMEAGFVAPAPIWSDARTFNGREWRGAVDGLIGGIPCQPHSLAGKRLGDEDERDLWSDARRIIVQSGAWFVLIENVRGMLSSGGAERVYRDLQRLGFTPEGGLFTAREVGASHERERLFILAVADSYGQHGDGRWLERTGRRFESTNGGGGLPGLSMANTVCSGLEGRDGREVREQQPASQRNSQNLANASGCGCGREGDASEPPEFTAQANIALVDTISRGCAGRSEIAQRRSRQRASDEWTGRPALFPPGPDDIGQWREILDRSPELEPAFRRVDDGLATRMDLAQCWSRVDRLRQLGNGVVSLEAAYALRTLATRLAARGSTGARVIVRLMGLEVTP